jgi:hypothetical protein
VVERESPQRRALHIEQSPLEKVRLWVEILAFAAAGAWAIYTFVYQTQIAPAFVPAHEVFAVSVQRLASTASGNVARVQLTIRNDGTVDVDTAALALNVFAAATPNLRWQTVATPQTVVLHSDKAESWSVLQAYGHLYDGAVGGQRNHLVLRQGDSTDLVLLVAVPREDHLLRVDVHTSFDRFPIRRNSVAVKLLRRPNGAVDLYGHYPGGVDFTQYFGV